MTPALFFFLREKMGPEDEEASLKPSTWNGADNTENSQNRHPEEGTFKLFKLDSYYVSLNSTKSTEN